MPSAATCIEMPIEGSDLATAIAASVVEAALRLQGEATDLVSAHTRGQPGALTLVTTWRREWTEPEPEPAAA